MKDPKSDAQEHRREVLGHRFIWVLVGVKTVVEAASLTAKAAFSIPECLWGSSASDVIRSTY